MSAWASANRLMLGEVKVDCKSNEITAIPELIELLDLAGCVVLAEKVIRRQAETMSGGFLIRKPEHQPQTEMNLAGQRTLGP